MATPLYLPKRRSRRGGAWMNIIPLIDVLIVLLFFFITTTEFKRASLMNITPPTMETAGHNDQKDQLIISVTKDQKFYFNDKELSQTDLSHSIKQAAQHKPGQSVLIIADEDAPLKAVTWIMDQCRKEKLYQIKLQSR